MIAFSDRPIRVKILLAVMLASFLAVFVSGAAFLGMNIVNSNRELETNLQNKVSLLAVFSEVPLDFDDAMTAELALNRIAQDAWVTAAGILRADGSLLAHFPALETPEAFSVPPSQGTTRVQSMQVIAADGRRLGRVYLAMDVGPQRSALYRSAMALTALVTMGAWATATFLTIPLRRVITQPILDLRQVAQDVARNPNQRAQKQSQDEIGALVDEFNAMLDTIAAREKEIREQEAEYHSLVDNVSVGICRLAGDPGGTIVQANPATAQMLGVAKPEQVLGVGIETYFSVPNEWRVLSKVIGDHGQVKGHELEFRRSNGTMLWCSFSARVRRHETDGGYQAVDTVIEDITERKKAELALEAYQEHLETLVASRTEELEQRNAELRLSSDRLEQTNEELKTFAYIVSHDLRAPLVNLKGFAAELDFAVKDLRAELDAHFGDIQDDLRERIHTIVVTDMGEALNFINTSVTRMDGLLNSILKLSRIGRREMIKENIDTKALVQEILQTLGHQLESQNVEVVVGDLPDITGDRVSIDQIFGNLLDNAVKYLDASRPGRIEITGRDTGDMLEFTVKDNGRGISDKDLPKIFQIFRRVGALDKPGEGMGLSYVRTLVRRHGGEIFCTSTPGEGSTFVFTLHRDGLALPSGPALVLEPQEGNSET